MLLKKINEEYLHNLIQLTNALIEIVARNQKNIKKEEKREDCPLSQNL